MDLIVCFTPLQLIQCQKLIEEKIIGKCKLIFLTSNDSKQIRYYYEKFPCDEKLLYLTHKRFPFYALDLKAMFNSVTYNNVFLSNVDSIYCHYILSFIRFSDLFTFDDGTINLVQDSGFYINKRSLFYSLLYKALGCKYDLNRTKSEITQHFSIYKDHKNIVDNVRYINLEFVSNEEQVTECRYPVANVLIGTVYDSITNDKASLLAQLNFEFKNKEFYYIPHPMEIDGDFDLGYSIPGYEIAEIKILNLLNTYNKINVYGFNSSVQINVSQNERITNYKLSSEFLKIRFNLNYSFIEYHLASIIEGKKSAIS